MELQLSEATNNFEIFSLDTGHLDVNFINESEFEKVMGVRIRKERKNACLKFIKTNFGKISEREMAKKLEIGKTAANRWAKELGLKHEKHTVNEEFFDTLNEASAYVLGYIYADGNVSWNLNKSYWALTITAASKDKEHLEKIRILMSSTKPLLYSPKTNSYRFIVNSKQLCQKLMKLGVAPRKSLTVKCPELPSEVVRHFIRGIIDGDGTVRYCKRKKSPYFEIRIFSGSKKFCQGIIAVIENEVELNSCLRKISRNTYEISYSCTKGKELAKFIYSNSNIFLRRKYVAYKENVLEV